MGKVIQSATNPIGAITNVATFGQVGFDGNKFGRGVATEAANKASGGALSKIGNSIMDTAFGKKTPGTPDQVIDMADPLGRELQRDSLGKFGEILNQDTSQIARNQIAGQEKQILQNAQDGEMRAKQLVAQRGLGNSSLGLNAILGQSKNTADQIGDVRASLPGLENQMKQQNLGFATNGINSILNEQGQSKVLKMGQQAQGRGGGLVNALLPIAGSVAGGMASGGAFNGLMGAGAAANGLSAAQQAGRAAEASYVFPR